MNQFPELQFTRQPTVTATEEELTAVRLRPSFTLPRSYRDFAKTYGYGLLLNLFIVYIPMKGPDSLTERNAVLTQLLKMGVEEKLFDYKPDGSPELVGRLVPFGISENGDTLAWDPERQSSEHEYEIFFLSTRFDGVFDAAPNLYEFVNRCLDLQRGPALLKGAEGLIQPTFKPIEPFNG